MEMIRNNRIGSALELFTLSCTHNNTLQVLQRTALGPEPPKASPDCTYDQHRVQKPTEYCSKGTSGCYKKNTKQNRSTNMKNKYMK